MNTRKIVIVISALAILAIGKFGKDFLAEPEEREKPQETERRVTVFTDNVELGDITLELNTTGSLQAKDRMELFSEVQGLMLPDAGRFKAGNSFSQGQALINLRSDDARANVVAQRSTFERTLSAIMADIRLDHPTEFFLWDAYLKQVDVNSSLPSLPEVTDPKLKSYLTGRSIYSTYYSVRNAEISLSRFTISAPFSGVLVSADVTPGTVVRPGQRLGVFVKPGIYELQASTDAKTASRLAKGQLVTVHPDGDPATSYEGKVIRVNASIDPQTQMSDFFVEIRSDELKDGQFMQVEVQAEVVHDAYELNRSALKNSRYVFLVNGNRLKLQEVEILHTTEKTAVISGLKNGDIILTKVPPTAFEGMEVEIYTENPTK